MKHLSTYRALFIALLTTTAFTLASPAHATSQPLPETTYAPPSGAASTAPLDRHGLDRALGTRVSLILADHPSRCLSDQPTLFWYASGGIERIEHVVSEADTGKPLLRHVLQATPDEGGFFALPLADFDVRLRPGISYRWTATLAPEGTGQTATVLGGEFYFAEADAVLRARLAGAPKEALPALYGTAGAWCDMLASLTVLAQTDTDRAEEWFALRARSLRQVGLVDAARADEARLPLRAFLQSPRDRYRAGERIQLTFGANRRFHARLIYEDAAGQRIQVLPNAHRIDNGFDGHTRYHFPTEFDQALTVAAPFGRERITLQTAVDTLPPLPGQVLPNGFVLLDEIANPADGPPLVEQVLHLETTP
ncbi:DUF928 domain-containing protein [Pseudothauera nasutitermitis]|uniref:DUF928 domain-containing protein n=1 Tax=Pseudothauera nasutitermitis TaxID=2565930 RepID=A0A4S4B1P9_9RHOO|nr:DUF928 domain-containing protein [Pseudothauera nasutitermitis]THF65617.1 DUF928 domain-containing protein [Pseudothauera nasutitermitis]